MTNPLNVKFGDEIWVWDSTDPPVKGRFVTYRGKDLYEYPWVVLLDGEHDTSTFNTASLTDPRLEEKCVPNLWDVVENNDGSEFIVIQVYERDSDWVQCFNPETLEVLCHKKCHLKKVEDKIAAAPATIRDGVKMRYTVDLYTSEEHAKSELDRLMEWDFVRWPHNTASLTIVEKK